MRKVLNYLLIISLLTLTVTYGFDRCTPDSDVEDPPIKGIIISKTV
jgi:hypothetical protein